jgi:sugar phosphate isomerase/epimerase
MSIPVFQSASATTPATAERLAVCTWSLQPADVAGLVGQLQATSISRVQLALNPLRESPGHWVDVAGAFRAAGISVVSGMFGCVGEDYTTLESIRLTGGIAPDGTWEENLRNIRATAKIAAMLGLKLVTFHVGFVPDNLAAPGFGKMLERLATVVEIFAAEKIALALETGQEAAPTLAALLRKLGEPTLGVNFDPANIILYGKGDPIAALHVLHPWVRQVHIKDARPTRVPGTWGEEVVAGTGEVDWRRFFATLKGNQFAGNFVIEREAGTQRVADIHTAREVVLRSAE